MKIKLTNLILLASAIYGTLNAQNKTDFIQTAGNNNVVYYGIGNPIFFKDNTIFKKYTVVCDGCEKFDDDANHQFVIKPQDTVQLAVRTFKNKGTKLVAEQIFKVERIPDPFIKMNKQSSGDTINLKQNESNTGVKFSELRLVPQLLDFPLPVYVTMKGYTISFTTTDNILFERTSDGNRLSPQLINILEKQPSGIRVDFTNIQTSMPDGSIRIASAHFYLVK